MKKHLISVAILLVFSILLTTGCSSATTSSSTATTASPAQTSTSGQTAVTTTANNEPVTLSFLHKWPEEANMAYFQSVIDGFVAEHPNVTIKMEAVGDQDIKDKLRVMVGGSTPDIFFSWSGEFAAKFVRAGNVLPLDPYFEADAAWRDSFIDAAIQPGTFESKSYGIPMRLDLLMCMYNKKIFSQYSLQAPETWDQFMTVCQTLKDNKVTPILFGNQQPWAGAHYLTALNSMCVTDANQVKDVNPKTGEFTDAGYVQALDLLKSLQTKGYMSNNVNSTTFYQMREVFYTGKGGIFLDVLSDFPKYKENMGDGNWGFFGFPNYEQGASEKQYIVGGADMFMVSSKCKNPDVAVAFLKYMTNSENAAKFAKETGYPIPVKGAVNENTALPETMEAMKYIEKYDGIAEWLDTAFEARIVDKYLTNIQEIFDSKDTTKVMQEIQTIAKTVRVELGGN